MKSDQDVVIFFFWLPMIESFKVLVWSRLSHAENEGGKLCESGMSARSCPFLPVPVKVSSSIAYDGITVLRWVCS